MRKRIYISFEGAYSAADLTIYGLGKWIVVGFALCLFTAQAVQAKVGFQVVSPDELSMTGEPLAPGASAILLFREVDRDDSGSTAREDEYFRIKILTEDGRKFANVQIPFLKGIQDVVKVQARTIRPDGSISEFSGQPLERELVKAKGIKYFAKVLTLPDVQVGSIIEYFYTMSLGEHKLYDSHWILSSDLFTKKAQFSLKPYRNEPFSLRWSWHDLPTGVEPQEGRDHIVRMEATNIAAFVVEDYMPPANELKSRVDFIYEAGGPYKDQDNYWTRVGKLRNEQLESFVHNRKAMENAVVQMVSSSDSQDVKLRKIYDEVQKIRNASYETRKTQQEVDRDKGGPENAEQVLKRGYGSKAQLNWLFLGLLRAAGFEAYGCWVSNRREYIFSPVSMQSAKLNANVVLVKLNGKDLYLDPGTVFTPFGMLIWSNTAVTGLQLDKDGGNWIRTTLPQASESRIEHAGKLKLSATGDLDGTLTVTYVGLEALNNRMEERNSDETGRKKFLESLVASELGVAAQVELTNKPDWSGSETPLVAEFKLKIPNWASDAGKRVVLPAAIFTAAEKGVFDHANRVQPVYFEYPYEKTDDVTIDLPSGWRVTSTPSQQDRNGKVVLYSLKVEQGPAALRLTRKFTIDALLVEQKYYPNLRNFFQAVRSGDGEQIVLQP